MKRSKNSMKMNDAEYRMNRRALEMAKDNIEAQVIYSKNIE